MVWTSRSRRSTASSWGTWEKTGCRLSRNCWRPPARGRSSETMVVASLHFDGALELHSPLEAQLQATLNLVPAYAWYALPNGALAFVNQRTADYLGLPKDHPLRFGAATGADWDSHIPLLHPDD